MWNHLEIQGERHFGCIETHRSTGKCGTKHINDEQPNGAKRCYTLNSTGIEEWAEFEMTIPLVGTGGGTDVQRTLAAFIESELTNILFWKKSSAMMAAV